MKKKLSLMSVLKEDIDLSKANVKRHPHFNDIIESPIIGLYAFAQAYNKIVYNGIIDGPTLNINQISSNETKQEQPGNLKFSKNSFKMDLDPEAKTISLFGNRGTEHDIIHIVTTNLAKNFARLRGDGKSRFNKKYHFKAKSGTPQNMRGPGPEVFGDMNFTDLGQYSWEELLGNYLNDIVRSNISQGMTIDPKRTAEAIMSKIKRAYTEKDVYFADDIGGIPDQFKLKILDTASRVIYQLLIEYNKFLGIYKHSAMKQQGMENIPKAYRKRKVPYPERVIDDGEEE